MFFKEFSSSIRAFSTGFKLIQQLKLWNYFFIPVIIALILAIAIFTGAWFLADPIGEWMAGFWPFDWGSDTVSAIAVFIGGLSALLIGLIIFKHAVMALSAPFMGPLSEKIEMHLTGKPLDLSDTPAEKIGLLVRGIRVNLRNLFLELLISFPFLILSLIPILNLGAAIALLYIQWYFAGYGNLDYALERHCDYSQTKQFVRKHRGLAAGNGLIFHLLLLIPVAGLILALPLSTAAATVSVVQKMNNKK